MVIFAGSARRTLFLAGWHIRLRLLRIRRERTLLVTSFGIFVLIGARLLPRSLALAERIHAELLQFSPDEQAMARTLLTAFVWLGCIVTPAGHIVEPAPMRRYPFTLAERIRARLLAQAVDHEWLFLLVGLGLAPPIVAGLMTGVSGAAAWAFTIVGLAALWLSCVALRDATMAGARLGLQRSVSAWVACVPLVWFLSLIAILVRHMMAVRGGTAEILTTLPPLWPAVWWAHGLDAVLTGRFLSAFFWLCMVFAGTIAAFALTEFLHARSQTDPLPRTVARHRSRIAERVPLGPIAAIFAKEWLALRRDPMLRSAYAGAIVLPLLGLGWMALGRDSVLEWKSKAFWVLGIATAYSLGSARGSSLAFEYPGIVLLRQLPARFLRLGFGMDLVQWVVTAIGITLVLATAGFILGPTAELIAAWGTSLALAWGFLASQHLVARFFPFHVERTGDLFETPLVASLLGMLVGFLVMLPALIALDQFGPAGSFAAALLVSPLAYRIGLHFLEKSS